MLKNVQVDYIIIDERNIEDHIENFIHQVKKLVHDRYVPIILMTRNLKKSYETQVKAFGVDNVLREPLDKKEILSVLKSENQATKIQNKVKNLARGIASFSSSQSLDLKHRLMLNNKASEQVKNLLKEKQTLTLLMIEIDQYHNLILQYGESAGAPIVAAIENLINSERRPQDVLIALGGGKWILMLPKTSKQVGLLQAEEIRKAVDRTEFPLYEETTHLTASIGLTEQQFNAEEEQQSVEKFNRSLKLATGYAILAKQSGNQIITE
jgi:diguanylate cyclase (GGDEF)-like protein